MTATFLQARDEIIGITHKAWLLYGLDAANLAFPDKPFTKPTTPITWARIHLQHVNGGAASLGDFQGKRRFMREGFITIQVFVPSGNGLQDSYPIGNMLVNAYEVAQSALGIWFRNVRANEAGLDGDWQQLNVIAEFSYDEIN